MDEKETLCLVRRFMQINPSLMFSGKCGEAFRCYASLFGGEIVMMLTYGESPAKSQAPDDWNDKVWFARLRVGGLDITGGDLVSSEPASGFSMVANLAAAEVDRIFAGLSEGGEILVPLQETAWSPRYGIVRDAFGIRWEINGEAATAEPASFVD